MRNYNLLVVSIDEDYQEQFVEFMDSLQWKLGWMDIKETIHAVDYDWINYDSLDKDANYAGYIITDRTEKIDPEKLMDAFDDWMTMDEDGHYDEEDDWIVDTSEEEKKDEFITLVVKRIRNSNAY